MGQMPKIASSTYHAYIELTKPNITFLILVSTALGYYLGANGFIEFNRLFITLAGTCLVSSGAGALNHVVEKDSDWLMERTNKRPLPAGLIDSKNAKLFGLVIIFLGAGILYHFINPLTSVLAFSSNSFL